MKNLLAIALGLSLCVLPSLADDKNNQPPRPTPKEKGPCSGTANVGPGASATNNDGVTVSTNGPSQGSATLTPSNGTANCKTVANAGAGWSGYIKGLDSDDFASAAGGGIGSISGTGGVVSVGGGSYLVTNTSQPGGTTMTVNWSGGPTLLLPGQSVQIP
jgi:hypothetical protein